LFGKKQDNAPPALIDHCKQRVHRRIGNDPTVAAALVFTLSSSTTSSSPDCPPSIVSALQFTRYDTLLRLQPATSARFSNFEVVVPLGRAGRKSATTMNNLGQIMRHLATLSLVCVLRLAGHATVFLSRTSASRNSSSSSSSSPLASTTVHLLATCLAGVSSVVRVAEAAASERSGQSGDVSAAKLRSMGDVAVSEGKFSEAEGHFERAVALEPDNPTNHHKLYGAHKRARRYGEALSDIARAVELDVGGKRIDWRLLKAKLLLDLGRCEEAASEYREAQVAASNAKGREKEKRKADDGAKEASECVTHSRSAMSLYQSEKWSEAASRFGRVLSYTLDAPDVQFLKAQAEYNAGDYYGAISDSGKVLKGYPKHVEAYQLRGEAYVRLNEMEVAKNHFREGLVLDPEHKGACEFDFVSWTAKTIRASGVCV
ncbi:hypothetical protein ACHAWF_018230, partial [Thalassiosira exigua]